jgi:glycosyltransferase involved in cell wall biosynthesis
VTCNSLAVVEHAIGRGVPPERIRLVRNGHPPATPAPFPDRNEVRIGYLAHFRREKGHTRLLSALELMQTPIPWRLSLAGTGPLLPQVSEEIRARGLADRVELCGPVEDARKYWAENDIAALLSDHEGSPNALIEAALTGRPIVATSVGGNIEVVGPKAGYLVPADDPLRIATVMRRLIESRSLREQLGANAADHASQLFDLERFLEGHTAVLREAIRSS